MFELRLIDPDGYTVPGTVHTNVPAANEAQVRQLLLDVAERHAAEWADFGYHAADYRVQEFPEPTVAARGTFLDWLAASAPAAADLAA